MGEKNEKPRRKSIKRFVSGRIHSKARSRIDTSDIVSQTELSLWLSGHDPCSDEFSKTDPSLLRQVSKRALANEMRYQGRQKRDYQCEERTGGESVVHHVDNGSFNSEKIAEQRELYAKINIEIREMGEVYWRIYHLRYFFDAKLSVICKEVGLTRRKVDTYLKKLHQHIQKTIGPSLRPPNHD